MKGFRALSAHTPKSIPIVSQNRFLCCQPLHVCVGRNAFRQWCRDGQRRGISDRKADDSNLSGTRRAYIALGSNLGDRVRHIESALSLMNKDGVKVKRTSSLYETKAMYYEDQGSFLNGVCSVDTTKEPLALLDSLQNIESTLGRERTISKGPRNIDLDVIAYGSEGISHERLAVPHPGLSEREFVLRPLNDISPDLVLPMSHPTDNEIQRKMAVRSLYRNLQNRDPSMSPITYLSPNLPPIRTTDPNRRTHIMAILNLTPDSFSDGGQHSPTDLETLRSTILNVIASGASIIDVGGQSTRPGSTPLSAEEELSRILPALGLIRSLPEAEKVAISIDTFSASVAKAALDAGADIINDVSGGLLSNDEILDVVAQAAKTVVLMHMRGTPATMTSITHTTYPTGFVKEVGDELVLRVNAAERAGIPRWRILLDPGIGFAKNLEQNLTLLRDLKALRERKEFSGLAWVLGTSRKKFIGTITGKSEPRGRVLGTAATVVASIAGGADVVRVHDVAEMREVVAMSDAIYRQL
jgi:2-amino-4-hydroxy-6-hydroxymethyldihydropteridine diphosphokinase / dihydropteroate synthase